MDIEKINQAIRDLKQIDCHHEHAYEKSIWLFMQSRISPNFIYKIPKGRSIFRSRTHGVNKDFFNKISEIGITPRNFIEQFGRCNRPKQSVFYASENRQTSYAELIKSWFTENGSKENIHVTIGAWKLKKDMNTLVVTSPNKADRSSCYDKKHGLFLDLNLSSIENKSERKAMHTICEFLFEIFRKPSNGNPLSYNLTAAYSNLILMHPDTKADGISYPSVPFGFQGVNYAVTESFAKKNLDLIEAMRNTFEISINEDGNPSVKEINNIRAKQINLIKDQLLWS